MKQIKAFTIIETIVALLIIVTVFAIATVSFSKIYSVYNLNEKLETNLLMQDYAIKTKSNKEFVQGKMDNSKYLIEKQFEYYQTNKSLLLMTITARDLSGKIIDTHHEIILLSNEKN